jgi:hypothetical protein
MSTDTRVDAEDRLARAQVRDGAKAGGWRGD